MGKRLILGAVVVLAVVLVVRYIVAEYERHATEVLLRQTEAESEARARALGLTRLQVASADALAAQLRTRLDGALADVKSTRAKLLLAGSTPKHTLTDTPTGVGPVEVTNKATAAVVALPDGRPYVRGEVETTVALPQWHYAETFKEPLVFEQAVISEAAARACPSSDDGPVALDRFHLSDPPTLPPVKHWHWGKSIGCGLGLIAGVVSDPSYGLHMGAGAGVYCGVSLGFVK